MLRKRHISQKYGSLSSESDPISTTAPLSTCDEIYLPFLFFSLPLPLLLLLVSELITDKNTCCSPLCLQQTPKCLTQGRCSINVVELNQIAVFYKGLQDFPPRTLIMPIGIHLIVIPKQTWQALEALRELFKIQVQRPHSIATESESPLEKPGKWHFKKFYKRNGLLKNGNLLLHHVFWQNLLILLYYYENSEILLRIISDALLFHRTLCRKLEWLVKHTPQKYIELSCVLTASN